MMALLKRFTMLSPLPTFTIKQMDEIIRNIGNVGLGEGPGKFYDYDCLLEGLAFAESLKEQIIANGFRVPSSISAKHTNWLGSIEQIEQTYSLVLAFFNLTGTYDIITERIVITGSIRISNLSPQ